MRTLPRLVWTSCTASALALGLFVANPTAQARPKNATAECADGTFSTAKTRTDACQGHGGVKTWFADQKARTAARSAKSNTKDAAKSTKDAGKDVGSAAASVGKTVGSAAKDVGKTTATAGKQVGKATADAVKPRPSDAPADATGRCKDGTYSHASARRGACSAHGGVSEWYGK